MDGYEFLRCDQRVVCDSDDQLAGAECEYDCACIAVREWTTCFAYEDPKDEASYLNASGELVTDFDDESYVALVDIDVRVVLHAEDKVERAAEVVLLWILRRQRQRGFQMSVRIRGHDAEVRLLRHESGVSIQIQVYTAPQCARDPRLFSELPELRAFAPIARVVDKYNVECMSCFDQPSLSGWDPSDVDLAGVLQECMERRAGRWVDLPDDVVEHIFCLATPAYEALARKTRDRMYGVLQESRK